MSFLLPTNPTPYDLNFSIGNIPVRVHPLFWVVTLVFALAGGNLLFAPIWLAVVFVSILIHELGHALTMQFYGQSASIVLHAMGGMAVPESLRWGRSWASVALTLNQEILVYAAGPGAGFLLATLVLIVVTLLGGSVSVGFLFWVLPWPSAVLPLDGFLGGLVNTTVGALLFVNLFWGLMNLLPVYPLDGGNIAQRVLIQVDPVDGGRKALWLSTIAAGIAAVGGLLLFSSIYMAFLFGFLAFQSYQALSRPRY